MPRKYITLIRHGQALHNATGNNHLYDPCLSPLGITQCQELNRVLNSTVSYSSLPSPLPSPPSLLVSSPLTRTLQTTLIAFSSLFKANAETKIVPLALLQETADLPCDTGRDVAVLKEDFGGGGMLSAVGLGLVEEVEEESRLNEVMVANSGVNDRINWDLLDPLFPRKDGIYAPNWNTLQERATLARKWLWEKLEKGLEEHIVCVLHGGFLHYLINDWTVRCGSGWLNTEFRTYEFLPVPEGQDMDKWTYELVETEESRQRRKREGIHRKPLTDTEE